MTASAASVTATGRASAGWIFAANHLMLLVGLLGTGRVRAARGPLWLAGAAFGTFGLLLLTGCEIWALRLTDATVDGAPGPAGRHSYWASSCS